MKKDLKIEEMVKFQMKKWTLEKIKKEPPP